MQAPTASRYATYRRLMANPEHWQKTLGIISCKTVRAEHKDEFNKLINTLLSPSFRNMVRERDWQLAFSGGTFHALPGAVKNVPEYEGRLYSLAPSALGIIQIANLVVYGHLFAVLFYNHMEDLYADSPQNLCLRRICNYCDTSLFEDSTSIDFVVKTWEGGAAEPKAARRRFNQDKIDQYYGQDNVFYSTDLEGRDRHDRSQETLAIVSHDDRKMTMLNFCLEHMVQILSYKRVLSTGTTGEFLSEQLRVALEVFGDKFSRAEVTTWGWNRDEESPTTFLNRKIQPFESGPKGGDVQISAKVIDGSCHRVLFFRTLRKRIRINLTSVLWRRQCRIRKQEFCLLPLRKQQD